MKNERLQNVPKLFPLSNYASRTVVENYFPTHNQKDGSPLFSKELTIMKKHYEPTQQMMMFLSEIMSTTSHLNRNALLIGMTFLHSAARIEAQTKRSILPLITPTQLVDYLGAPDFMEYEEGTDKITKVNFGSALDSFRSEENNLQSAITPVKKYLQSFPSFEAGASLMRDFIITAPTL